MWLERLPEGTYHPWDDLCILMSGHCPTVRQLLEDTTLFPTPEPLYLLFARPVMSTPYSSRDQLLIILWVSP